MKNSIYNKIYNALVIDDDSSINYKKSEFSNKYNQTFYEFYQAFINNNEAVLSVDTKLISVITEDGNEISLAEAVKTNIQKLVLLKLSIDSMENDIIISTHNMHGISNRLVWSNWMSYTKHAKDESHEDPDGYKNTMAIYNEFLAHKEDPVENMPAVYYCMTQYHLGKSKYSGYMPSMNEMMMLVAYIDLVNYILHDLLHNKKIMTDIGYWTSTELKQDDNKNMVICIKDGGPDSADKNYQHHVLPFYRKIK